MYTTCSLDSHVNILRATEEDKFSKMIKPINTYSVCMFTDQAIWTLYCQFYFSLW